MNRCVAILLVLLAALPASFAQAGTPLSSAYGAAAKTKWSGPGPGSPHPTPDPTGTGTLEPIVKPIKITFGTEIKCKVVVEGTQDDIVRPGDTPKGQNDDPHAFTGTVNNADGSCTCHVSIESDYLKSASPQLINDTIAHELCHCQQTARGQNGTFDPSGNWTAGPNQIKPVETLETNASVCARKHSPILKVATDPSAAG